MPPTPVIDFHAHVIPDHIALDWDPVRRLRKQAREWLKPFSDTIHQAQTMTRHLPNPVMRGVGQLSGAFAPVPTLLFELTVADLRESMFEAGIDQALVMSLPPMTNDGLIQACREDASLHPVATIPPSADKPKALLKRLVQKGSVALKISPAADGEPLDSRRYKSLLQGAAELGIPVIIPTGCPHARIVYRDAGLGEATLYTRWFKAHPDVRFVLAHMNYHRPLGALDAAGDFGNVSVDTSWQPAETIAEAVRRLGAERVLFASDWPFVGNNHAVSMRRVRECVDAGIISAQQSELILGANAARLLRREPQAPAPRAGKADAPPSADDGDEVADSNDAT